MQEFEEAVKENQQLKDKCKDIQNQVIQKQNQLAEVTLLKYFRDTVIKYRL